MNKRVQCMDFNMAWNSVPLPMKNLECLGSHRIAYKKQSQADKTHIASEMLSESTGHNLGGLAQAAQSVFGRPPSHHTETFRLGRIFYHGVRLTPP